MATCQSFVSLPSAARTAAVTGPDIHQANADGVRVILDVTVDPAAASITVSIQGKDPISGKYYTLLGGAAVAAVGTNVYTIYPSITAVANVSAPNVLPSIFRINVAVADTDSMTYSINYELLRVGGQ